MKIQTIPATLLLPSTIDWTAFFGTPEEINLSTLIYQALEHATKEMFDQLLLHRLSPADVADLLKTVAEMQGGKKVKATFAKLTQNGKYKHGKRYSWSIHFATTYAVTYHVGREEYMWTSVCRLPKPIRILPDQE